MKNFTYLAQTDTTVGLLSQDYEKLYKIKQRPNSKKLIISVASFETLNNFTKIPKKFRKQVRNSKKTTFVYPNNKAIRVIKDEKHLKFLSKIKWCYTTSANLSGKSYDFEFAQKNVDVIVYDTELKEKSSSTILKLGKTKCKKLR